MHKGDDGGELVILAVALICVPAKRVLYCIMVLVFYVGGLHHLCCAFSTGLVDNYIYIY